MTTTRRRPNQPRDRMRRLFVSTTIELLRVRPFKEVTVRRVAAAAGEDPSVIRRQFGSMNGLFIAVCDELVLRAEQSMAPEASVENILNEDIVLRIKLSVWLMANGVEASRFRATSSRPILDAMSTSSPRLDVRPVVTADEIIRARGIVNDIYVDERVKDYIVNIVWATRDPAAAKLKLDGMIRYGASPRATIYLTLAAKANAFIAGRGYVTPQDVKTMGLEVLRHRIAVSYEAEAESVTSEMIIEQIFAGLPVP